MKKGRLGVTLGFLAGMMILATPPSAVALVFVDPGMVGSEVKLGWGPYGSTRPYSGYTMSGGFGSFVTFCLERNEYFSPGHTYKIDSISKYAVGGGIGGDKTAEGDPISGVTASLYYNYVAGNLGSSVALAEAIQQAIWCEEGEMNYDDLSTLAKQLLDAARRGELGAIPDNIAVMVINLEDENGNPIQSQLCLVQVPEPSAILMMGAGLVAVSLAARRRRKKRA
jgi:hypothetical protein